MNKDMTVPCEEGLINLRVGAIIMKNGKILMVGNNIRPEYLYSVGGRIKFGETSEEAVIREVYEETGVNWALFMRTIFMVMQHLILVNSSMRYHITTS